MEGPEMTGSTDALASTGKIGLARVAAHHGEILQGVFQHDGRLCPGLVTMPCSLHESMATFVPAPTIGVVTTSSWREKATRAAELTLALIRQETGIAVGGRLDVVTSAPSGRGFGSSTSDVLAAIGAVTNALSITLPAVVVARLAVEAETASDSLMFAETAVLFGQRSGHVIENFGRALPAMTVLGFGTGTAHSGVDTLALPPPRYDDLEIGVLAELRALLRQAVAEQDVELIGEVASSSTEINQRRLPIVRLHRIRSIGREAGAAGVQTAHSGDIAGLLFDAGDPVMADRIVWAQGALRREGIDEHWVFSTRSPARAGAS